MTFPRFFSPTVTVRLFDPMPLPRKTAAIRRSRIEVKKLKDSGEKSDLNNFTYKVRQIPINS